jgi:hypothetical protein
MTQLLTDLDDVAETIAYGLLVAALKADATLAATIPAANWTTYTETADDDSIRNVPTDARGLPAIQLLPQIMPASPQTQVRQRSPLSITVTITVAGRDVRDLFNLWGAFRASIFTGDGARALNDSIRAALAAAGVAESRLVGSLATIALGSGVAIGPGSDNEGLAYMTGQGTITAEMQVPK